MANKITVKFEASGDKALKKAINSLARAQGSLEKGQKTYASSVHLVQQRVSSNTKAHVQQAAVLNRVKGQFAVLRNSLLLYAFGYTLLKKTIGGVISAYNEQQLAEKKLEQALGGVNKGLLGQASALQQVTTFGDEAIISAQSLLAAFVKDEDQLKKATVATLDLAAAKGMDLNSAADLIGKTLGSSTNSLSRYGIEVEGVVGSTQRLDTLTNNIANTFGGQATAQADTLSGSIEQMKNAIGDTSEAIGLSMAPAVISIAKLIKSAAEAFSDFFKTLSESDTETTIRRLNELGAETLGLEKELLEISLLRAERETVGLRSLSELEGLRTTELNQQKFSLKRLFEAEVELETKYGSVQNARERMFDVILSNEETEIRKKLDIISLEQERIDKSQELSNVYKEEILTWKDYDIVQKNLLMTQKALNGESELRNDIMDESFSMLGDFGEFELPVPFIDSSMDIYIDKVSKLIGGREDLIQQEKKMIALEQKRKDMQFGLASGFLEVSKAMTNDAEKQKNITFILAMIDAYKIYLSTLRNLVAEGMDAKEAKGYAVAELSQATLMASVIRTQKFEQGGLVGGQRHSQGGTMIEAERGEYVMSRNAVESIGVNNLEAMNAGGGAVNINITGNVMSSDFVEGELADKITEAVRKGVDFGIS